MIAGGLAACNSSSGVESASQEPAETALGQFFRGTSAEPTTIDPELMRGPVACPTVSILSGTEVVRRDDGTETPEGLRWQASIVRTARECERGEGEAITLRIGVSGRVVAGPKGAPEVVELPVRIAVREGETVSYSRVHNVRVTMSGVSQSWAYVDGPIPIAAPGSAQIVVGFDS
ncbi:hypothetical protein L1787_23105 [Acuticoccus sp. M5D2P5]|uniref:hypothetical protein n=1 Tax=Acuticoccus kalidii TaxID=2910977 RepID=UPI001F2153EA|nr:hypothetical protein [Acuticoccus kalidii]MCF3936286.1 hypothetical protein [Acuticoccus kalidii]